MTGIAKHSGVRVVVHTCLPVMSSHFFWPLKSRVDAPPPAGARPTTALERPYAAQEPDVAKRMTMPIDIALALSRLP